jgi:RNA polymerase sigma-70 factor (ECF subfamily)
MNATIEWDLIRRCREGATGAFEPLVRQHEGPGLGFASALLGNEDDAADAVQDAFVLAFRKLPGLSAGSPFGPWFRAILRNVCLDRLRSPGTTRRSPLDTATLNRAQWTEPTADRTVEHLELGEAISEALATLPEEQRSALLLREVEGLSYAEIAATLGIPPGTVASRLNHGRASLKAALMNRGIGMEYLR